jgi:hypothetical protein
MGNNCSGAVSAIAVAAGNNVANTHSNAIAAIRRMQ